MATETTARAIATANISFGLVSIPVKLFSAGNSSAAVSFNMLHGKCGSRVKQQYICPKEDNVVVPRDEIRKGYEFAKDQYVLFTDEELKALEEQATQTVDVTEFVPLSAVDPVYFDKAYYLGPDKGGSKAYWLFAEVLKETGRVALAKYAARGKQYLVMVRAVDEGLVMQQLLYADEVRSISEVGLDRETPKEGELKLAKMLVAQASSDEFRPEAYEDDVKKRIQEQLKKKIETGQEISAPPRPKSGEVIDLMEALRRSLTKGSSKPSKKAAAAGSDEGGNRRPAKRAGGSAEKRSAARK
jgi:DNA end-binding protein Ku